ncbi:MAG: hypothetical protein ACOCQD_00830, partial [archaeon]
MNIDKYRGYKLKEDDSEDVNPGLKPFIDFKDKMVDNVIYFFPFIKYPLIKRKRRLDVNLTKKFQNLILDKTGKHTKFVVYEHRAHKGKKILGIGRTTSVSFNLFRGLYIP